MLCESSFSLCPIISNNIHSQSFRDADLRVLVLDGSSLAVDDSLSVVKLLEVTVCICVRRSRHVTRIIDAYIYVYILYKYNE